MPASAHVLETISRLNDTDWLFCTQEFIIYYVSSTWLNNNMIDIVCIIVQSFIVCLIIWFHAEGLEGDGRDYRQRFGISWHSWHVECFLALSWQSMCPITVPLALMYAERPSYSGNRFQQVGRDSAACRQKVEADRGCGLSRPFVMLPELVGWHISLDLAIERSQCE